MTFTASVVGKEEDLARRQSELNRSVRVDWFGDRFPHGTDNEDIQYQDDKCRDS